MRQQKFIAALGWLFVFANSWNNTPRLPAEQPPAAINFAALKSQLPELNLKIVRFCESKLGEKVGSGECAVLASESLKATGGVPRRELPGPAHPMVEDDYIWGTLLKPHEQILPGDILQFRDVELKYHYPDGSTRTQRMPHHTAIVYKLVGPHQFIVLHQNIGKNGATDAEKKIVKADPLDIRSLQRGTIWAYRPRAKMSE